MLKSEAVVSFLSKGRISGTRVNQVGRVLKVVKQDSAEGVKKTWHKYESEYVANIKLAEVVQSAIKDYTMLKKGCQGKVWLSMTDQYGQEHEATL